MKPGMRKAGEFAAALAGRVWFLLKAVFIPVFLLGQAWMLRSRYFHTQKLGNIPYAAFVEFILADLVLQGVMWGTLFLLLALAFVGAERMPTRLRRLATAVRVAALALAYPFVMGYIVDWAMVNSYGRFFDVNIFSFVVSRPGQLLEHALQTSPAFLGMVLLASGAVVAALTFLSRARPGTRRSSGPHRLVLCVAPVLSAAVILFVARSPRAELARLMLKRYSPAGAVVFSMLSDPLADEAGAADASLKAEYPRIVTMNEYLRGVKRDALAQYNVVLVLVESLRPDQLVTFGGTRQVMPNLDALAAESWRFRNAFSESSYSDYADTCSMGSQYPLRSMSRYVYRDGMTFPRVLIYDILKGVGYRTAVVSSQNEYWGGLYHYLNTGGVDYFLHAANYKGSHYLPGDSGFKRWAQGNKYAGKIDDSDTVDSAIRWIGENGGKPFFLYLNFQNSHVPYVVPDGYQPKFLKEKIDFQLGIYGFPKDKIAVVKDKYADSLHYTDRQWGRLARYLKDAGLYDKTILVVTGDNGQAFYEHGYPTHGTTLYNEMIKVPLIVRMPGRGPEDVDGYVEHIDVAPTLLALLGLPPHPGFQGRDALTRDNGMPLFGVVQSGLGDWYSVIQDGWKFLLSSSDGGRLLFDLEKDPGETANLAAARQDRAAALERVLRAWMRAQTGYYSNPVMQKICYPPRFSVAAPAGRAAEGSRPSRTGGGSPSTAAR